MEHAYDFEQHMEENRTEDEPQDQQDDEGNESVDDLQDRVRFHLKVGRLEGLLLNFNRKLTESQR